MATKQPAPEKVETVPAAAPKVEGAPASKSNKKLFIIIGLVVFFVFILPGILFTLFAGFLFTKGGEKLIEEAAKSQGIDADVNTNDGSYSFKSRDGEVSVNNSKQLPEGFPESVITVYDGAIINSSRVKVAEGTMWTVSIETNDSLATVRQKLKDQLTNNGWTIASEFDYGADNFYLSADKTGQNYNAAINALAQDNKTTLTYTLSETPAQQ